MYAQDYDDTLPYKWYLYTHVPVDQTLSTNYLTWPEAILSYVRNDQIFQCPDQKYAQTDMPYTTYPFAYNYNGASPTNPADLSTGGLDGATLGSLAAPTSTVMIYDGFTMDSWWYPADQAALVSGVAGPTVDWPNTWPAAITAVRRHNDGANICYADGHAKWANRLDATNFTRSGQ
jgi:prepilin-type processing-associated H-X9-DG protein